MTRSQTAVAATIFFAAVLALFLSFDFSGDYAINDDWGYSTPVRWWVVDRQRALTHWQSMPLLSQLFLGVAWAEVFGFSQGALRQLNLVLALTTCAAVFACARALALPASICLLCALLPLASPIFVGLSYSFMTDVPTAALVALSLLFLIRSFSRHDGGGWDYAVGVAFLLLAVLLRQTSLALALALVLAEPVARGFTLRGFARNLAVVVGVAAAYLAATALLREQVGLPTAYGAKTDALVGFFGDIFTLNLGALRQTLKALLVASANYGLFALAILPILLEVLWRRGGRRVLIAAGAATGLAVASLAVDAGILSGTGGNMLTGEGLGPRTIPGDVQVNVLDIFFVTAVGHFVLVCSVLAGALGLRDLSNGDRDIERETGAAVLLLALTALVTFAPHAVAYAAVFDRYALLPSILMVLALLRIIDLDAISKTSIRLSGALVLAGFALSLALAADYFRWQDARYSLIGQLQSEGVAAEDIDGGFEYNNLEAVLANPRDAVSMSLINPVRRPLRLTRAPEPGDEIVAMESYTRFLGAKTVKIYAVRPADVVQ
ncbi:MAG: glycosyltransferase family 39 protein [Rhizobiaceae bacterium]